MRQKKQHQTVLRQHKGINSSRNIKYLGKYIRFLKLLKDSRSVINNNNALQVYDVSKRKLLDRSQRGEREHPAASACAAHGGRGAPGRQPRRGVRRPRGIPMTRADSK